MNIRFHLFVSGVNQGNEERRQVQDFLLFPQGSGASPQSFRKRFSTI